MYDKKQEENEKCSRDLCRKFIEKRYAPIKQSIQEGKYFKPGGYRKLEKDFEDLEEEYTKTNENLGVMVRLRQIGL